MTVPDWARAPGEGFVHGDEYSALEVVWRHPDGRVIVQSLPDFVPPPVVASVPERVGNSEWEMPVVPTPAPEVRGVFSEQATVEPVPEPQPEPLLGMVPPVPEPLLTLGYAEAALKGYYVAHPAPEVERPDLPAVMVRPQPGRRVRRRRARERIFFAVLGFAGGLGTAVVTHLR